jgi:hypothetical protein
MVCVAIFIYIPWTFIKKKANTVARFLAILLLQQKATTRSFLTMTNIQFTDLIEPVLHIHLLGRTLFVESGGFMVAPDMRRAAEITVFIAENHGLLFLKEGGTVAAVTVWDPDLVRWFTGAPSFNANQFHERVEELKRSGAVVAKGEYRFFVEELQDAQTPYETD